MCGRGAQRLSEITPCRTNVVRLSSSYGGGGNRTPSASSVRWRLARQGGERRAARRRGRHVRPRLRTALGEHPRLEIVRFPAVQWRRRESNPVRLLGSLATRSPRRRRPSREDSTSGTDSRRGRSILPRAGRGRGGGRLRRPGAAPASEARMEAAGIEPASAAAPGRASTSLACALISPGRPVRRRPTAGPAILSSHPSGDWLSFGASPLSDAASRATGPARGDALPNYLGSECEITIRTYVVPGCFTRPTGDLDSQLSRRTDHVETWSPPYVFVQSVAA